MKPTLIKTFTLSAVLSLLLLACSKEQKNNGANTNKAHMQIRLTDDPGDYEAVLIDIKEIKINMTSDDVNGWQTLTNVNTGQYDLLKLVNDKDTLLADVDLDAGKVHQMRLVLGTENFVKTGGQLIRLETPSAQQSGLKLNIQQEVEAGLLYKLLLDFDVAKSIVKTGNSKYILKPTIRTMLEAAGGTIQGTISPYNFQTAVLVFRGTNDTVTSTYSSTANGGYRVRGLAPGIYSLRFLPGNLLYRDTVISGINVVNGRVAVADTMKLGQ